MPLSGELLLSVQREIETCTSCSSLRPWRRFDSNVSGRLGSKYVLVGEAPGYRSWKNGRRFTGPAGLFLRRVLKDINDAHYRELEDLFYMTDSVKCHPARSPRSMTNRSPRSVELENCLSHLIAELRAIRPAGIVTFGKCAAVQVAKALEVLSTPAVSPCWASTVIEFPHPSPRNTRTIHRQYGSYRAFEGAIRETFCMLISQLHDGRLNA